MKTKSHLPLFTIIVISLILFISAFLWKVFHVDNSEEIYIEPVKSMNIKTSKHTEVDKHTEISKVHKQVADEEIIDSNPLESSQKQIKKLETSLNLALMYKTPEDVIKAIEYYESQNNFEKVDLFTNYLSEKFPDYQL